MNQQQKQLKVILIGDTCIDEYHYGVIEKISPEAPVPIFLEKYVTTKNGMASNVADNLKNLGVDVISYFGLPSTKIRLIDMKSKQHILRIDKDIISNNLIFDKKIDKDIDAIIVSDYDKGFVSYELIESLIKTKKPVFIDTKKTDLRRFNGAFVKINSTEYSKAKTLPDNLIVTNGEKAVKYKNNFYEVENVEMTDVCGAGDTFLSSLAFMYLKSKNIEKAIQFAIKSSSITVKHIGVYAPTLEEIQWKD